MNVLFAPQAFDDHGKEEKLAPGVYNLVRDLARYDNLPSLL